MKTRHGYIDKKEKVKDTCWLVVCGILLFSVFIFGFWVGTA